MTLHLATLIALGVANVAPGEVRDFSYRRGNFAARNIATSADGTSIIRGSFLTRTGSGKLNGCGFELVVVEGCVIRAKGCHLQGQAPLCPEGQWN